MPSEHQAAWCVGGLFTAVFGFQVGNQAIDAFGLDGFAKLVAVYGNQACAFDCDIVCAVFAAALVGGEVHVDRFWPETLISARTTISLPPLFTTGLSLMLTLAFLNFSMVPE